MAAQDRSLTAQLLDEFSAIPNADSSGSLNEIRKQMTSAVSQAKESRKKVVSTQNPEVNLHGPASCGSARTQTDSNTVSIATSHSSSFVNISPAVKTRTDFLYTDFKNDLFVVLVSNPELITNTERRQNIIQRAKLDAFKMVGKIKSAATAASSESMAQVQMVNVRKSSVDEETDQPKKTLAPSIAPGKSRSPKFTELFECKQPYIKKDDIVRSRSSKVRLIKPMMKKSVATADKPDPLGAPHSMVEDRSYFDNRLDQALRLNRLDEAGRCNHSNADKMRKIIDEKARQDPHSTWPERENLMGDAFEQRGFVAAGKMKQAYSDKIHTERAGTTKRRMIEDSFSTTYDWTEARRVPEAAIRKARADIPKSEKAMKDFRTHPRLYQTRGEGRSDFSPKSDIVSLAHVEALRARVEGDTSTKVPNMPNDCNIQPTFEDKTSISSRSGTIGHDGGAPKDLLAIAKDSAEHSSAASDSPSALQGPEGSDVESEDWEEIRQQG